jgi:hypothetical protein
MVYDYAVEKKFIKPAHDFEQDILTCALQTSKRYKGSEERSKTLELIALQIFDSMKRIHGMGDRERLLLEEGKKEGARREKEEKRRSMMMRLRLLEQERDELWRQADRGGQEQESAEAYGGPACAGLVVCMDAHDHILPFFSAVCAAAAVAARLRPAGFLTFAQQFGIIYGMGDCKKILYGVSDYGGNMVLCSEL